MRHARASNGLKSFSFGFSLLEVAIVLVIAGIILGIGTSAWLTMNEARRITLTTNRMRAAKDCLITRVVNSKKYPERAPTDDYANETRYEVSRCLAQRNDGWGQPIYFLEGFRPGGAGLAGGCLFQDEALPEDHPCGVDNAPVLPSVDSQAIDKDGAPAVDDVAFVLVSFGSDLTADDVSYGSVLTGGVLAATMTASTTPDFTFSNGEDDVVMIVTYPELLAAIARSEE